MGKEEPFMECINGQTRVWLGLQQHGVQLEKSMWYAPVAKGMLGMKKPEKPIELQRLIGLYKENLALD